MRFFKNLPYDEPILLEKIGTRRIRLVKETEIFGVIIPKGNISDGASVPRPFWCLLSPFAEGLRAAIIHDYRYTDPPEGMTKKDADIEFYHNLKYDGVNVVRRFFVYLAVRVFGKGSF